MGDHSADPEQVRRGLQLLSGQDVGTNGAKRSALEPSEAPASKEARREEVEQTVEQMLEAKKKALMEATLNP